ncbi:C40 family peptidase [Paenibacillus sp. MMS18-CY102]|uniref:C40 family peptidase n=1 Tax=Paenibacillus sp. MMS18-CY102 TaxID=2682849 RepID=UPI0019219027|nr:C40 family peptidase [Paenibacillus sp. MMS18-CY102]
MKKALAVLLGLAMLLTIQVGSAFADSTLDNKIDAVIGTPYVSGGTSVKGFDCSGFTQYVFKQLGLSLERTSGSQAKMGSAVDKDDLRAGDLVFFNTSGDGISHVGIYVGEGKFAHASSSKGVTISALNDSYYSKRYVTARRVMDGASYEKYAEA